MEAPRWRVVISQRIRLRPLWPKFRKLAMNHSSRWVYHDPRWWIDQITVACAPNGEEALLPPDVLGYMRELKPALDATLSYLSRSRNLSPYEVRRSLFFAKALKKWRLDITRNASADRAGKAVAGFLERNALANRNGGANLYACTMKYLLSKWLPMPGSVDGIHGRFGPGAVAERIAHPARFCRLYSILSDTYAGIGESDTWGHADVNADVCRLCAVPKDWDKDRLITVEPFVLSFQEQRARSIMLESIHSGPLRGTAMDLGYTDGQAIQRGLALDASRTGLLGTIDLSNASDCISWTDVQEVFPQWVVDLLWGCRSQYFEYRDERGSRRKEILYLYGGMGNATTFVVETLFFSAYVAAVAKTHGMNPFVSSFGDDIICSSDLVGALIEEGNQPFFIINTSKSFWGDAAVRESCGIYAHNGHDVTVPRVDGYPSTYFGQMGVADLHKRLQRSGDDFQLSLANAIAKQQVIPNYPFSVEGYPSIENWCVPFDELPKSRRSSTIHVREVKVLCPYFERRVFHCADLDPTDPPAYWEKAATWCGDEPIPDCTNLDQYVRDCLRWCSTCYTSEADPPADVWYMMRLLGCIQCDPASVKVEADSTHPRREIWGHVSTVSFPTGKVRLRPQWRRVVDTSLDDLYGPSACDAYKLDQEESVEDKVLRSADLSPVTVTRP